MRWGFQSLFFHLLIDGKCYTVIGCSLFTQFTKPLNIIFLTSCVRIFFLLYLVKKLDSKQVLLKIHYKNKIIDFVFFFFKPVLIKATVGIVVVLANMLSGNPQTWMAANRRILLSASSWAEKTASLWSSLSWLDKVGRDTRKCLFSCTAWAGGGELLTTL